MDKSILSKCALGSQKFKERSSPPKDLKANPQLKGRKVWRGTVEARSLRGSRRGALGPSEPDTAWGLTLAQAVWGGVIRVTLRVMVSLATFPPGWFSWEQRWSLPPPEPESEDRASLPACAGCRGTERLMSVTLAVESREGHVRACVCVCVCVSVTSSGLENTASGCSQESSCCRAQTLRSGFLGWNTTGHWPPMRSWAS